MELMVCIDGAEHASVPLRDGDDPFNAEAERGALDRAYEAKESCPDAVVSIVLAGWPNHERGEVSDREFIGEALALLADLDEGEHTDHERLRRLTDKLLKTPHPDLIDAALASA